MSVLATLFGISLLAWAAIASVAFSIGFLALCALFSASIAEKKREEYQRRASEVTSSPDLDDWLAGEELLDFPELWRQPEGETHLEQPDLRRAA